ncbi:hypothetical protein SprV_0200537400 [Sparganum proliferum]
MVIANASEAVSSSATRAAELESFRAVEFLHDYPGPIAIDRVKSICRVQEDGVEVGSHLLAFILQLANAEDHDNIFAVTSEATLTSREKLLFQMAVETIENGVDKDLPGDV